MHSVLSSPCNNNYLKQYIFNLLTYIFLQYFCLCTALYRPINGKANTFCFYFQLVLKLQYSHTLRVSPGYTVYSLGTESVVK